MRGLCAHYARGAGIIFRKILAGWLARWLDAGWLAGSWLGGWVLAADWLAAGCVDARLAAGRPPAESPRRARGER